MRIVTKTLAESRELLIAALRKRGITSHTVHSQYGVCCWNDYGDFKLDFMPGNRRTLVSHAVSVAPEHRGKGKGTELCMIRQDAARDAGVTLMLATVKDDNVPEIKVLTKCGWLRLTQNTETHCSLWGKQL